MTVPRMFSHGEPTNALKALRDIAKADDGLIPGAIATLGWQAWKTREYVAAKLLSVGWIEERRSGPRGGKRYFITEMGRHVLKLIDEDGKYYVRSLWAAYPEMVAEMKRLGEEPEESF